MDYLALLLLIGGVPLLIWSAVDWHPKPYGERDD